jgi:hypothetical protein
MRGFPTYRVNVLRGMVIVALMVVTGLAGCRAFPSVLGAGAEPEFTIATGVSDMNGLARVESAAGVVDFQVSSGLSGERLTGIRIRLAVSGDTRLLFAEDPTGAHLPVSVPLAGDATVRRLVMPPRTALGYNLTSVAGALNVDALEPLGELSPDAVRDRLRRGPDEAVLLYFYNPERPLALTDAALQAYGTPFENVTVLRAAGEPADAELGLVVVPIEHEVYGEWNHRAIDRYLAGRIGQPPAADLLGDLALGWAYPVYDVFPAPDEPLEVGEGDQVTFRVNWRSQNPDPPPPWSFFVSAEDDWLTVEPETFQLDPQSPPAEVTVTVSREGLEPGEYEGAVLIQPYSDAFGMIEQAMERTVSFTVGQAEPTATAGPSLDNLAVDPSSPREGGRMTVTGQGFEPNEAVVFEFVGPERTITDTLQVADESGVYTYEVDLSNVPAGEYTLRLTGATSAIVAEMPVVVGEEIPDAVVQSSELNLRTGPGYDYPAIDVLVRGDELEIVATNWDDTWIEVRSSTGEQGWVVTELVELNIDLENVPWNSNFPNPDL